MNTTYFLLVKTTNWSSCILEVIINYPTPKKLLWPFHFDPAKGSLELKFYKPFICFPIIFTLSVVRGWVNLLEHSVCLERNTKTRPGSALLSSSLTICLRTERKENSTKWVLSIKWGLFISSYIFCYVLPPSRNNCIQVYIR